MSESQGHSCDMQISRRTSLSVAIMLSAVSARLMLAKRVSRASLAAFISLAARAARTFGASALSLTSASLSESAMAGGGRETEWW